MIQLLHPSREHRALNHINVALDADSPQQRPHAPPEQVLAALTAQDVNQVPEPASVASRIALDLGIPALDVNVHKIFSIYITEGTRLLQLLRLSSGIRTEAPWVNNYLNLDLESCRDQEHYQTRLPLALDQLRRWSLGLIQGRDSEAIELVASLGRLLTWLCQTHPPDHAAFISSVYSALDDALSELSSWSQADHDLALSLGSRHLWLFWVTIELSFRLMVSAGQLWKANDRISKYIRLALNTLLQTGFTSVIADLNTADASSPISSHIVDVWICIVHLLQSPTFASHPGLWTFISDVFQTANWLPNSPLARSENIWTAAYAITALSQFTATGSLQLTPQLSACWTLISLAISHIHLSTEDDAKFHPRVLYKRDLYVRGLLARCLILNLRWGWKLTEAQDVLQALCEIFRSRQFCGLRGDGPDFPLFLTEPEGFTLTQLFDERDSGHDLFLKLVIRAVHDLREFGSIEVASKQTKKLISTVLPVGTAQFTPANPPTSKRALAKVYNRYSSVLVAVHLDRPMAPTFFRSRIKQAQRVSDFGLADWKSRHANIQAMGRFIVEALENGYALEEILLWQDSTYAQLLLEARRLDASAALSSFHQREEVALCIQLALASIRSIYERARDGESIRERSTFLEPELLQPGESTCQSKGACPSRHPTARLACSNISNQPGY